MDREDASSLGEIPSDPLEHAQHDLALELVGGLVERQGLGCPNPGRLLREQDFGVALQFGNYRG